MVIHPFSFEESLRHAGKDILSQPERMSGAERSAIEGAFLDYLSAGGFPEAQGLDAPARAQLLNDYVDVAMLRDVVERHGVTHVVGLRWLLRHLLGNAGSLFSVEKFYSSLKSQGFSISKDTVHHLLSYLEDCFLVRTVWMEAGSERQRMVNPRKAYPVDPGLIPVFDRSGRQNLGHALETVVLIELERRRADVTYVRTPEGHEVDFLARYPDGSMELIQVCAEAENPDTAERELRALEEAGTRHAKATRRLLTVTRDTLVSRSPKGIIVQPAYEWLLCGSSKQEKRKQPRQSHTTSVSTRHWISSRLVVSHPWREVVTPHKEVASGRCREGGLTPDALLPQSAMPARCDHRQLRSRRRSSRRRRPRAGQWRERSRRSPGRALRAHGRKPTSHHPSG